MKTSLLLTSLCLSLTTLAQNYTSYKTGNSNDLSTYPQGGICLMGGATEDDNAMMWFLERAQGGDVLVLRASGSDGYNNYMYSQLGINLNSVETIVCHNALASYDPYIVQKILQAEAIWIAGGDQSVYIDYWRDTPIDSALNLSIQQRNIAVGGTSAGMAIQGQYYFSAMQGTIQSPDALSDPYDSRVTIDSALFIQHSDMARTITDTHFDSPDRKGRLTSFLARILTDYDTDVRAIACDEYTAVCIDTSGIARVFGDYPSHDDLAYFIQPNCALADYSPENCSPGNALNWNRNGEALKVYQIGGDALGSGYFDLRDWKSGAGGDWYDWSVDNGTLNQKNSTALNCQTINTQLLEEPQIDIYPIPTYDFLYISIDKKDYNNYSLKLIDIWGQHCYPAIKKLGNKLFLDLSSLASGVYFIQLTDLKGLASTYEIQKI